jgi:hypothetical protein
MDEACWLCSNSAHPEAKKMHTFMSQNVSSVSAECMADLISQHLQKVDPIGDGTSKAAVQSHVQGGHLLNPSLQMAHTLRSLFKLRDTIYGMILVQDEDGGVTVDARNMGNYLKVVSEILQVYKTGEVDRLMYGSEGK